jgi:signal transduction histidine kinase
VFTFTSFLTAFEQPLEKAASVDPDTPAVDETLRKVVVAYRLLVTVWVWILIAVVITTNGPGNRWILVGTVVLAACWAALTIWAGRASVRLGSPVFVILDGLVALLLSTASLAAGTSDFVSGGWPASWLFTVAFAANLRITVLASFILVAEHLILHVAHGFEYIRMAGTFQYIVFAVIIGWAFDALREKERLRLLLQEELDKERVALEQEREATARHEERADLARHLHDEVLQTFHAIEVDVDKPAQVLYFVRRQIRELRRTIEEFRSPHPHSFRASLLRKRDEVEELHRGVRINEVIRGDAEVTPILEAALGAAREAMINAAKHSGVDQMDLYGEIENGFATIIVRDRGRGFRAGEISGGGMTISIAERVESIDGRVDIRTRPDEGTQVSIVVPVG